MGSVICPTNPLVINSLFDVLVLFHFFEVLTKHKFEEAVTEQGKLMLGHESKWSQVLTIADAAEAQPYPLSLTICACQPESQLQHLHLSAWSFLRAPEPALPPHTADRVLEYECPHDQPSTQDWWKWYRNTPTQCSLEQNNSEAYVLPCFKPHHKLLDDALFIGFFPSWSHFPTPLVVFPQIFSQIYTFEYLFLGSFWEEIHSKIYN